MSFENAENYPLMNENNESYSFSGLNASLSTIDNYAQQNPGTFFFNLVILVVGIILLALYKKNGIFLPFGVILVTLFFLSIIYINFKKSKLFTVPMKFIKGLSASQIMLITGVIFILIVYFFIKMKNFIPKPNNKSYIKMYKFETNERTKNVVPSENPIYMGSPSNIPSDILNGDSLLLTYNNDLSDQLPSEYTYSFWLRLQPENFGTTQTRWRPIMLKGSNNLDSNPFQINSNQRNQNANYRCIPVATEEEEEGSSTSHIVPASQLQSSTPLTFNINSQTIFSNKNPGIYLAPLENKMNITVSTTNGGNDSIEIYDIPIDSWFCTTIVLEGRSLDCYINGKLERTITLSGEPQDNQGNLYKTPFFGKMCFIRYSDAALNPDTVFKKYKAEKMVIDKSKN